MIGLPSGKVKLLPYSDEWKRMYEQEEKLIRSVIRDSILDIQHVGSTSIPGLESKPIIDIAVAVAKLDIGLKFIDPLKALGYEYREDAGIKGRHFFAKGDKDRRTHYLHVEELNGDLWKNHVVFRNYPLNDKKLIDEYVKIKRELAQQYPDERETYTALKGKFIDNIITRARKEHFV